MEETTDNSGSDPGGGVVDEIGNAVRQAAGGQKVVLIRIAVGRNVTVSRVQIAKALHIRFPDASVEISDAKSKDDSVVVKDIEVE